MTAAADQYAMGAVLYECLAGRPPFDAPDLLDLLMAHREDPPPPLPESLGLPRGLTEVVERALAKDPADRFPDARAMAGALRKAAGLSAGEELEAVEPDPKQPADVAPLETAPTILQEKGPGGRSYPSMPTTVGVTTPPEVEFGTAPTEAMEDTAEALASMVTVSTRAPAPRSRAALVLVVLAVAGAVAAAGWLLLGRSAQAPPPPAASASPSPPAASPAERARTLEKDALRAKEAGRCGEAIPALRAALAADASRQSSYYHLAACLALTGKPTEARDALGGYLGLVPGRRALAARLQLDGDFGRLLQSPDFRGWLDDEGQAEAPKPPPEQTPKVEPEPKDPPVRRRPPKAKPKPPEAPKPAEYELPEF